MDDGHLDDSHPASPSSPSARLPLDVRPACDHQISEEAGGGCRGQDFWKNLGFCPNQVDPPPLSPNVGTPKTKKMMFFCILGYSKHIIFS